MNKKIQFFVLIFLSFLLFGCNSVAKGENQGYPNKDLVNSLLEINQYFLENSRTLTGNVVISASGKGVYQGSGLEIVLNSTNEKNSVQLKGNVSSQTALFLIDSLAATDLNGSGFELDLASVSREYQLGETGNLSGRYLTLNEDVLTPFFKTNALYFETHANKVAFAKGLSKQLISSTTEVQASGEIYSVYTMSLNTDSLSYVLPFTIPSSSQPVNIRLVQNQNSQKLSHIDMIIYKDRIANQDQTLAFDIDVSLQFDVRLDGGTDA